MSAKGCSNIGKDWGVFVPTLDIQEIHEIYELREILESEAASRVCNNPPPNMIAEMSDSCELMAKIYEQIDPDAQGNVLGDQSETWNAIDSAFHISLLRAAGNRRLLDTVKGLKTSLATMFGGIGQMTGIVGHFFSSEPRNQIKRTLDEHQQILEALKQGDGNTARAVMIEHIRSGLELALAAHNRNHMGGNNPLKISSKVIRSWRT